MDEFEEGCTAFGGAFVDTGIFEDMNENVTDFLLEDGVDGCFAQLGVAGKKFLYPVAVFGKLRMRGDIFAGDEALGELCHLAWG